MERGRARDPGGRPRGLAVVVDVVACHDHVDLVSTGGDVARVDTLHTALLQSLQFLEAVDVVRDRLTAAESSSVRAGASPNQKGMVGGAPWASSTRSLPGSSFRMRQDMLPLLHCMRPRRAASRQAA